MALRKLVDGECGQANPLMGVANQYMGTGKSAHQELFQRQPHIPPGQAVGNFAETQANLLVSEFLHDVRSQHRRDRRENFRDLKTQHRFRMDNLLQDIEGTQRFKQEQERRIARLTDRSRDEHIQSLPGEVQHKRREMLKPNWVDEFTGHKESQNEFLPQLLQSRQAFRDHDQLHAQNAKWADDFLKEKEREFTENHILNHDQMGATNGSWVDEFANLTIGKQAADTGDLMTNQQDINETEFMRFVDKLKSEEFQIQPNGQAEVDKEKSATSWAHEFVAGPAGLNQATPQSLAENWSHEFIEQKQQEAAERGEEQFWQEMVNAWKEAGIDDDNSALAESWANEFDFGPSNDSALTEAYRFAGENEFRDMENPLEEGIRKLEEGDIPSAVLMFEAAAEKEPENVRAWLYLGTSQQQNEFDSAAIPALRRVIELDPNNLSAIMALAVSYTNESMQTQACRALNSWIKTNPQYSHLAEGLSDPLEAPESQLTVASIAQRIHRDHVKRLFIQAARLAPNNLDPDVQTGLGVLFNLSGEYDKAADCFQTALNVRPTDSLLWNRLGATLANGSKPEEAVAAYREALRLSPGFIRSRFNLGISCASLGAYREAIEHFLSVLNAQDAGRGTRGVTRRALQSGNVWSTMRMCMTLMGRADLYAAVDNRDLSMLNTEFNMTDVSMAGREGGGGRGGTEGSETP